MAKAKATPPAGNTQEDAEHRRRLFVEAYLTNGGNSSQAAMAAGYSAKTAGAAGSRLLKHVEVAALLKQRRAVVLEKAEITAEKTLREIARLAYADPRKLFNADGSPKGIHELDDDTAASIAGIEVLEQYEGSGKDRKFIGLVKKYKLAGKAPVLDMAMKHKGQYEADNLQRNPIHEMTDEQLQRFIQRKAKEAGATLH